MAAAKNRCGREDTRFANGRIAFLSKGEKPVLDKVITAAERSSSVGGFARGHIYGATDPAGSAGALAVENRKGCGRYPARVRSR